MIMLMANEDLVFLLERLYPGTQRGVDYLVAHNLSKDRVQQGHAFIWTWKLTDTPEPTQHFLETVWAEQASSVLADRETEALRFERNTRLAAADIMVERAIDKQDAAAEAVARAYRQALRDVPQQPGFPDTIDWPVAPQ